MPTMAMNESGLAPQAPNGHFHRAAGSLRWGLALVSLAAAGAAQALPGYSVWGDFKYQPGFQHFDYVNPKAPKGGEFRFVPSSRVTQYDKLNPFTLKGRAPTHIEDLLFDSLLTRSLDEPGSAYPLLAEDVEISPDGMAATFRLNPKARFHNGLPVLASDVKHTVDMLKGEGVSPGYTALLAEVAAVEVVGERVVRVRFKEKDRLAPYKFATSIPIISAQWGMESGKRKPIADIVTDVPIGSGPYRFGEMKNGKDVTYLRDPNYWGRDLPVNVGLHNFDRIVMKVYADNTARTEAFKAGEFDLMQVFSARNWARDMAGKRFDRGELVKLPAEHKIPQGHFSYFLNNRLAKFSDWRVRYALDLAMDYEWMNRQLFRDSYTRIKGVMGNTECEAKGLPDERQLALLAPFKSVLRPEVFGEMAVPPRTDGKNSLRGNLLKARALLKEAGWEMKGGKLRNAQGEAFSVEFLDTAEGKGATTTSAWKQALEKLGIEVKYRTVDWALFQERLDTRDFEIAHVVFAGSHFPGSEREIYFGSKSADTPGSYNLAGIKNPAVDELIRRLVSAPTKDDYYATCRALDRVIAHGHYFVTAWTSGGNRLVYNAWRIERPEAIPPHPPESLTYMMWPALTWWARMPPKTAP